jgi:hypothetical protein
MSTLTPEQRELVDNMADTIIADNALDAYEFLLDMVDRRALADHIEATANGYEVEDEWDKDYVRRLRRLAKALRQPSYAPQALREHNTETEQWNEEARPRREAVAKYRAKYTERALGDDKTA